MWSYVKQVLVNGNLLTHNQLKLLLLNFKLSLIDAYSSCNLFLFINILLFCWSNLFFKCSCYNLVSVCFFFINREYFFIRVVFVFVNKFTFFFVIFVFLFVFYKPQSLNLFGSVWWLLYCCCNVCSFHLWVNCLSPFYWASWLFLFTNAWGFWRVLSYCFCRTGSMKCLSTPCKLFLAWWQAKLFSLFNLIFFKTYWGIRCTLYHKSINNMIECLVLLLLLLESKLIHALNQSSFNFLVDSIFYLLLSFLLVKLIKKHVIVRVVFWKSITFKQVELSFLICYGACIGVCCWRSEVFGILYTVNVKKVLLFDVCNCIVAKVFEYFILVFFDEGVFQLVKFGVIYVLRSVSLYSIHSLCPFFHYNLCNLYFISNLRPRTVWNKWNFRSSFVFRIVFRITAAWVFFVFLHNDLLVMSVIMLHMLMRSLVFVMVVAPVCFSK